MTARARHRGHAHIGGGGPAALLISGRLLHIITSLHRCQEGGTPGLVRTSAAKARCAEGPPRTTTGYTRVTCSPTRATLFACR